MTRTEPSVFSFDGFVSEKTLRAYLSRAVTMAIGYDDPVSPERNGHRADFILDIGAKYICRFGCVWGPCQKDWDTYPGQKAFIESLHEKDPDIVLEACLFEHVTPAVETLKIPRSTFEAFGLPYEDRHFSYPAMLNPSGDATDFWYKGGSVPDITQLETQMFFYARACAYLDIGYEAFHMGQIYLIGRHDKANGYPCYTRLCNMIRDYARVHARRHFVFLNAHIHGIIGTDGKLLLDLHMWPGRFHSDEPEPDAPMPASVQKGRLDSLYGRSLGGLTHSGWSCDHLPYMIEIDNWGNKIEDIGVPDNNNFTVWGYDEISWFANQSDAYRARFLKEVTEDLPSIDPEGYFAMPGERIAYIHEKGSKVKTGDTYYAYDPALFEKGCGDQKVIKQIWSERGVG